ncbi:MAG: NAD-dependent succinate-semialdehyde dehydrogenase [Pseudomonadota bacterium]
MKKRQQLFINGEWADADSGETIEVTNPATGEGIGAVPKAGRAETARAIDAAAAAFPAWRAETADTRSAVLYRIYEALMDNKQALGAMLTEEMGKPLAEAEGEIVYSAGFFKWFAEEAHRVYGDTIPSPWADKRIVVTKEPVGVVGAITPWNFPSSMLARKMAAGLAVGCTFVMKPASATPFSGLVYGDLAAEAGAPKGVVNILTGSASEIANELCENHKVAKITFTGSTEVGKTLAGKAAANLKRISMELGGNAPFIVFDDADIDAAVDGCIKAKFRNGGQTCVCANRVFVQDGVYDAFTEKLAARVADMTVGDGKVSGTDIGPMIDEAGVAKVEEHIADGREHGGRILAGGARHDKGGLFFQPTVLADASPDMKIFREETFGPVAPVFKFKTEDDVIRLANDTEYGLAAYFYSRDLGRAWRVMEALEYGMVGVNEGIISTPVAPFGGVKHSGFGREGSHYGVDDYLNVKYALMGGLQS